MACELGIRRAIIGTGRHRPGEEAGMKTLILEPDPMRARTWTALYGGAMDVVHLARTAAQARLMLIGGRYDRLCLRMGGQAGGSHALLSVARAMNPDCEIVDLASQRRRKVTGPIRGTDRAGATAAEQDHPVSIG